MNARGHYGYGALRVGQTAGHRGPEEEKEDTLREAAGFLIGFGTLALLSVKLLLGTPTLSKPNKPHAPRPGHGWEDYYK